MNYREKLLDPRWQKKRLSIFKRDDWECVSCGNKDNTLHAHHIFYEAGHDPWDYPDYALITLCAECHEYEHDALKASVASLIKTMAQVGIRTSSEFSYLESVVREKFCNGVFNG